jgi:Predicted transcriptional regulators
MGLTQVAVAHKAQISERYYQRLEAGASKPTVGKAELIAKTLNSTVEELFGAATPDKTKKPICK